MGADLLNGGSSRSRQTTSDSEFLNMRSPAGLDTAAKLLAKGAASAVISGLDTVPGMIVDHLAGKAIDTALQTGD